MNTFELRQNLRYYDQRFSEMPGRRSHVGCSLWGISEVEGDRSDHWCRRCHLPRSEPLPPS